MAFTAVLPGSTIYPEVMLEWAPTTQPTDAAQTYVDITNRWRAFEWGYGRNDELGEFDPGTGSVLLSNSDRAFDPSFNAGPWFGNIKTRRMFRLQYRYAGVTYPGFVGYARGFPQAWRAAGLDSVVKVNIVDAFAVLQGVDLVIGFTRPAEMSGERITAVLDALSVPAAFRDIDTGTVMVDAITIDTAGTSGLDHAKNVAIDSEGGQLFVAKDGKITFHDYSRRLGASNLWTFTDTPGAARYYGPDFEPAFDETYLLNYARVTGAIGDESAAIAQDGPGPGTSQDDYHIITKTISTQLVSGSDIQQVADRMVLRYAQPEQRAPSLQLIGAGSPAALWPVILDLEVSDRITVNRFASSADPMVLVQNVEGISHSCTPGGPWDTTIRTSPADTRTYMKTDDATLGLTDSGNMAA